MRANDPKALPHSQPKGGASVRRSGPPDTWRAGVAIMACMVVNAIAGEAVRAPGERWVHPAFAPPPLQLPGTFDQQTVVVLADGRLMTVHPKGNAIVYSSDAGRTWSEPRPIRTATSPVLPTRAARCSGLAPAR